MKTSIDYSWKPFSGDCPYCGNTAEVFTSCTEPEMANDGDAVRCVECHCPGSVIINEEGMSAANGVEWHDETCCECEWCKEHPAK